MKNQFSLVLILVAVLFLAGARNAHAETKDEDKISVVCAKDIKTFCSNELEAPGQFKCLIEHKAQASSSCQNALAQVPIANPPALPRKSGAGFAALGAMGMMPTSGNAVSYGGWVAPQSGQEMDQQHLTVQVPISQGNGDSISMTLGGTYLHSGQPETLETSGIAVPQDLWKAEIGASYFHRLDNDKFEGARISVGSASDRPFDGIAVTTISVSAFYSWPGSENSRWIASVFFSNNNPILNYVPIPGIVYLYQTDTFVGLFGFPFTTMVWTPKPLWMFTFGAFGPTINSEIAYGDPKKWQIFTGYSWLQQSYLREDRPDANDRLYYNEMHIPLGIRFPVGGLLSELSAGYTFDRSFYEGDHIFKRDNGSVDIPSGIYYAWNLRMAF